MLHIHSTSIIMRCLKVNCANYKSVNTVRSILMSSFQWSSKIESDTTDALVSEFLNCGSPTGSNGTEIESEWNYEADENAVIMEDCVSAIAVNRSTRSSDVQKTITSLNGKQTFGGSIYGLTIEKQVANFLAKIRDCQLVKTENLREHGRKSNASCSKAPIKNSQRQCGARRLQHEQNIFAFESRTKTDMCVEEKQTKQFKRRIQVNPKQQNERRHNEFSQHHPEREHLKRHSARRKISESSKENSKMSSSSSEKTPPMTKKSSTASTPKSNAPKFVTNDFERPISTTQKIIIRLFREKWEQKRNTRISRDIFQSWKRLANLRHQETVAIIERYNWYMKRRIFLSWVEGVIIAKREHQLELEAETRLMERAVRQDEKRLLRHYFYAWLVTNRLEKVNKIDSAAEETVKQQSREFIQRITTYSDAEPRTATARDLEEEEVNLGIHENTNAASHTVSSRKQTLSRRSAWSARLSKNQARYEQAQVRSLSSRLTLQAELRAREMTEEALKRIAVEQEKRAMQTAKRAVKEEAMEKRRDALTVEVSMVNSSSSSARPHSSASATNNSRTASTFIISPASERSYIRFQRSDDVLKQVELRKLKRVQLMQQYEERRDRIRREKLEQLRAEAEKVDRELREEKRRKAQELREKQRCEEERQQRLEALRERQRHLNKVAADGRIYLRYKYYGFLPWLRYAENQRKNAQVAYLHNSKRLLRDVFQAWSARALRIQEEKKQKAITFFHSCVCHRFFFAWIEATTGRRLLFQAAVCHYEITLIRRIFLAWAEGHADYVQEELIKQRMAEHYCRRSSESRCFKAWRNYLPIMFAERAHQRRLAKYRDKVRSFLPDFSSPQTEVEEALS